MAWLLILSFLLRSIMIFTTTSLETQREPLNKNKNAKLHFEEHVLKPCTSYLQSASTVTDNKLKFQKRNIAMTYFDSERNSAVSMEYSALMSLSTPRAVIKSNRSGKVFLDKKKNWKDCRAWVKINDNV